MIYFSLTGVTSTWLGITSFIQVIVYIIVLYFLFKRKEVAYKAVLGFEGVRLIYTLVATIAFFPGYFQFAYFNFTLEALRVIVQIAIRPLILWTLIRKSRNVLTEKL